MTDFKKAILQGIPSKIPPKKNINYKISHAPIRKDILTKKEKKLAICNALRRHLIQFQHHLGLMMKV